MVSMGAARSVEKGVFKGCCGRGSMCRAIIDSRLLVADMAGYRYDALCNAREARVGVYPEFMPDWLEGGSF